MIDQFVKDIPLTRLVAKVRNTVTNFIKRKMMDGARFSHHILFEHQTSHIIGSVKKSKLAYFHALCHPTRLDVGDIIQIQAADRLRVQVSVTTVPWQLGKIGMLGLECPADKCRKASSFIL